MLPIMRIERSVWVFQRQHWSTDTKPNFWLQLLNKIDSLNSSDLQTDIIFFGHLPSRAMSIAVWWCSSSRNAHLNEKEHRRQMATRSGASIRIVRLYDTRCTSDLQQHQSKLFFFSASLKWSIPIASASCANTSAFQSNRIATTWTVSCGDHEHWCRSHFVAEVTRRDITAIGSDMQDRPEFEMTDRVLYGVFIVEHEISSQS